MVSSKATSVEQYLKELPADQARVVRTLRDLVNKHLPKGYAECMIWGMIGWVVPLSRYPVTYNGQPLAYLGLAAQKNNFALYTMGLMGDPAKLAWFQGEFARAGLKLDMGKSCIRFKALEALPLPAIGEMVASLPLEKYLERYERFKGKPAARPTAAAKASAARAEAKYGAQQKLAAAAVPAAKKKAATKKKAAVAKPAGKKAAPARKKAARKR